ncbi:MAG: carbon-nitrogen hydrolase family protein, partial [Anaerolineae bacterium]|nr:carbon-nitrogen hydrolase family protein [Anaerolineae bacterium]
ITLVEAPPRPRPVRLCVVTGKARERTGAWTVARNLAYYSQLCRAACQERPHLILLPEVALQWQVEASPLDLAVAAPGPETEVFARLAREYGVRILLGLFERDGDAVFNSAILISPGGRIDGKYRKVHLAVLGESDSGVRPGDAFPVFETELGRLGCNICMDTSAAESSRMLGLNGAEIFLMPIMGDHRADRWTPGPPIYNESRWRAIMRTRAMDNQYAMAIARNEAQGSCIIDRKGDILAWNEGDQDQIAAEVNLQDGYRTWNNGCFRGVNWVQRRPHLYRAFVDEENWGNL